MAGQFLEGLGGDAGHLSGRHRGPYHSHNCDEHVTLLKGEGEGEGEGAGTARLVPNDTTYVSAFQM